mmetsp:Transcript_9403/g.28159  ORF Transcript_9403/g.28159 Transcript_9403/m.28159 type:complete len:170 (+) Transcript_9403:124-633(+)
MRRLALQTRSALRLTRRRSTVLACLNVGLQRYPLDAPEMREFVDATPRVNEIAKEHDGFVWSFDNDSDAERAAVPELVDDPLLMPQLSTWRDVASLRAFAFRSGHVEYYKRRKAWFTDWDGGRAVLWWVREQPSLADAFDRWRHLRDHGPSPRAFTFKTAKKFPLEECT